MPSSSTPLLRSLYRMGTQENLHCVKGISYFKLTNDQDNEMYSCYTTMVNIENCLIPYTSYSEKNVNTKVDDQKNDARINFF